MKCPKCSAATYVTDSRETPGGIRRRRVCSGCQERFTTKERLEGVNMVDLSRLPRRHRLAILLLVGR